MSVKGQTLPRYLAGGAAAVPPKAATLARDQRGRDGP
jgi:hypothetical protein